MEASDDAFWDQFWGDTSTTVQDIFALVPAAEIRAVREESPSNLATLCYKVRWEVQVWSWNVWLCVCSSPSRDSRAPIKVPSTWLCVGSVPGGGEVGPGCRLRLSLTEGASHGPELHPSAHSNSALHLWRRRLERVLLVHGAWCWKSWGKEPMQTKVRGGNQWFYSQRHHRRQQWTSSELKSQIYGLYSTTPPVFFRWRSNSELNGERLLDRDYFELRFLFRAETDVDDDVVSVDHGSLVTWCRRPRSKHWPYCVCVCVCVKGQIRFRWMKAWDWSSTNKLSVCSLIPDQQKPQTSHQLLHDEQHFDSFTNVWTLRCRRLWSVLILHWLHTLRLPPKSKWYLIPRLTVSQWVNINVII